jgi:hypothetical protein
MIVNPYLPPECQSISLHGAVYGHDRFEDGLHITTSSVVDLDIAGGRASTISGSEYSLGKPNQEWMRWLRENKHTQYLEDLERLVSKFII